MKIKFIHPGGWLNKLEDELDTTETSPDVILGMSIIKMAEIYQAVQNHPKAKFVMYQWDMYDWVFDSPRPGEYDYKRYIELIKLADLVLVPSEAERVRTKKRTGKDSEIVKSYTLTFELDETGKNYVFNPLRELPDSGWHMAEKACKELDIPYVGSDRNLTFDEYKEVLSGASFLLSPNLEASTGGLSLLEGYYNGKPVLINGNGENGAVDYFGDRGNYYTSFEDMKVQIKKLWENPQTLDVKSCRKWVDEEYSPGAMARRITQKVLPLL